MTKILHLDASGRHEGSLSRKLSRQVVEVIAGSDDPVSYRDISQGLPFVDDTLVAAYRTAPDQRTEAQRQALTLSDELVEELLDHEFLVMGVPIYNFSMPAAFKAWADLVARAGITFKYTETGPVGLLENKKAYVVIASGGTAVGSEIDFLSPWLRHYLGFIGIKAVEIIKADGLMRNADTVLQQAQAHIQSLQSI